MSDLLIRVTSVAAVTNRVSALVLNTRITAGIGGPKGDPGSESSSYIHSQGLASTVWTVNHNLSYYPNVTVVDSNGDVVEGEDIDYLNDNQLTITFAYAISGVAYLS